MERPAAVLEEHKRRVRELARDYANRHPARDSLALAEGLGAKLAYADLGERDGAFDPEHGLILVNRKASPERQRFTLAHEVIHALLLEDDDLLSELHDAYAGEELEMAIETLCNVGAASLLVSEADLHGTVERHAQRASGVPDLARRAGVSLSTAMIALSEHAAVPLILALASPASKGGPLVVKFSVTSKVMRYPLATGTPVPDGHPVDLAYHTGLPIDTQSYVPFRSGQKMPAWVSAFPQKFQVVASFQTEGA
ncbi:Zn-dependent peptidase ImmA (M78 family) [Deinobacterium chartae]|uniref:Zn-dependent peptidase ImmA (M78 family) n=1 Tax=Deinobacterium chartae TaxID=521158 RepID=A0A841HWZ2_9DEIO|nr:ImmA/IrrE family metallo-endopeptidase [Deinobacterium chartae]MBB6097436.1 Zn-dependent peptidase ImmA (M78 family) [Deinobacterium chartae]